MPVCRWATGLRNTPDETRLDKTGKELQVLAERHQDKRLNSPNDITIDRRGRIYFTDPRYNNRDNVEQDKEGVYRIEPDGKLTRIIDSLTRPNGIVDTPDGRTLYIADNASPGGVVTLVAFDLDGKGNASNSRVLQDFGGRGIDGMTLDSDGRVWATAGTKDKGGMYVFQPDRKRATATLVSTIPMPQDPTNCTFGGKRCDVLYVTTTASLFRIAPLSAAWPLRPASEWVNHRDRPLRFRPVRARGASFGVLGQKKIGGDSANGLAPPWETLNALPGLVILLVQPWPPMEA
jgi:gluconolactonase